MKKISLIMLLSVFLLVCSIGIQAQINQPKLNQVELMNQLIGTWQANIGKDSIEVWDCQQYGKALIVNVHQVIKGQKIPLYINNMGFDSKENKFKGYALFSDGNYSTWISSWSTEKNCSTDIVQNFNTEVVYAKFESVIVNPKEFTWKTLNKDGVKIAESKFVKIK